MSNSKRTTTAALCMIAAAALAASPASARTVANTKDGRPNILVVMTDDQAAADVSAAGINQANGTAITAMPNTVALLGAQGATFNNAVDSFPLCCPSRATFITGQYSHNHGVGGNFWPYGWYGMTGRNNILPVWLHNAGYYTAEVGKWLNGYGAGKSGDVDGQGNPIKPGGEIPAGFDNWNGGLDVSAYDYFNFQINQNGKVKSWGDSAYAKALVDFAEIQITPGNKGIAQVLNWANKFFKAPNDPTTYGTEVAKNYSPDVTGGISNTIIKSQKTSKKPFFLWWSPSAPHREDVNGGIRNGYRANMHYRGQSSNPHKEDTTKLIPDPRPAPRYADYKFNWSAISSKPSFDAAPTDKPLAQQLNATTGHPLSDNDKQRLEANYSGRLGGLKAVDDQIKTLVATLKSTKQLDNTLIVFTSDNGWIQGEHRVPGDKYLPYEEAIRIPLIMRGPGIPANRKVSTLVTNVDFASTLLDAAKVTNPGRTQDGVSLLGVAKGTSTLPSRAIGLEANAPLFADASMPQQWDQPYRGVRTDRYKYVMWGTGEEELYDLQNDPYEMTNQANNSSFSAIKAALIAKTETLKTCVGTACQVSQ